MSIETRIQEINDHLIDDYKVLRLAGSDLTDVNKNIVNLKPTWRERLLYFMNNGTDEVWNNWDKVRTSGGSSFSIDRTEEAPMQLTYKGNTYQYSTTGKNLFDESIMPTNTMNGIKWEYTNKKIKISGTSTGTYSQSGNISITLQAGTYYFVKSGTTSLNYNAWFYNAGGTLIANSKLNNPFTISENATRIVLFVEVLTSGTSYNQEMKFMVSTTNGEYEPYTNGASPNPSYPQDIHVVSGDNSIEVCGKNLLNGTNDFTLFSNYVATHTKTDNSITITSTATNTYAGTTVKTIIQKSGTYTLSMKATFDTNGLPSFRIGSSVYATKELKGSYYLLNATFTTTNDNEEIEISLYPSMTTNTTTHTSKFYDFQIELGNISTPTYEPYQGASYPISLSSKNKFDFRTVQNGDIRDASRTIRLCSRQNIWLEAGTYTFSTNMPSTYSYGLTTQTVGVPPLASYPTYVYDSGWENTSSTTFTLTSAGYFVVQYKEANNGNISPMDLVNYHFQLEKGSTATDYVPYSDINIELCKIGTYQDKIDKSTGKNLANINDIQIGKQWNNASNTSRATIVWIPVKKNTDYYFTSSYTNSHITQIRPVFNTGDGGSVVPNSYPYYNETKDYVSIEILADTTFTSDMLDGVLIMLNEGTTALPYEPYGTDWYLKKGIGKYIYTGNNNESWGYLNVYDNNYLYQAAGVSIDIPNYSTIYVCTHALPNTASSSTSNIGSYVFDKKFRLRVPSTIATDVATFKTWLSNNNVELYYPLATPTYETITDTTLISQLDEAKKSYESQTNISQANNDLPFELDVVALAQEL